MFGREPALGALRAGLEAAATGRGRLLLVTGDAGIGKTAVVAALAGEAADAGALVLWGQCWESGGAPAYWPWVQVLRAGMAAGGGDAGEAARLLPETASASPPVTGASPDARFRLFDAMARHLAGLAARRPTVVVLDDLQWADESSLAMLEFCARHLQAAPVLILGAYRDDEAPASVRRVAASAQVVPLRGLAAGEVTELLTAVLGVDPPAGVAEVVWRRTGGNPLFAGELARLHLASGDRLAELQQTPVVPDSVREVLERRLARLSQPCADVLGIAAVMGPEVRAGVLARVAHELDDVAKLLHEAVAARVLVEPAAPADHYRFSHDLFRETVLVGLPGEARARLHLAVGRALEALEVEGAPVHPAELAVHFGVAVAAAPAEAVRYGMRAGEDADARLAFEESCAHYERALAAVDLAPEPDGSLRLELLVRLGDARNRAGYAPAALEAYLDAVHAARRLDDPTGLARSAIGIHGLGWRRSHAESISHLEEALRALPDRPSALRARVLAALARDLHHSRREPDWDRASVLGEEAVATARELDDSDTLAFCLLALHDTRWRPGTAGRRLPVVDEMLAVGRAAGDREMVAQARLLRATALIELGEPQGINELEAYCRMAEELGDARGRYAGVSRRATLSLLAGRPDEAEELAEEAFRLGQAIGEPDAAGVYETLRWAAKRVGGTWRAWVYSLDSDPWPGLPLAEALVRVAQGELDAARGLLSRLRLEDLPRLSDLEMLAFAAKAVAAAGSAGQQAHLYEMLRPFAGIHIVVGGCASYFGAVDHYLGILARALERHEDARAHFLAASALHDRLGAGAWARLSRAQAGAAAPGLTEAEGVLRRDHDVWTVAYRSEEAHLPDAKGLRDLAALLARPGRAVHAVELHTGRPPHAGADPVLDDAAKAAYRRRLAELEADIDEAEADHDPYRAEQAHAERDALITQLSAAVGLGGRDRRLGDDKERARKAVAARIRDAIDRIERVNPRLADHLRSSVQTGTWCTYEPAEPTRWRV